MAKISVQNIAQAIAGHTKGKSGGDLDVAVKETLNFLNKKKLLNRSDEILDAVGKIIDKEDGVVRIKVLSAKKIEESERKRIEEDIKNKFTEYSAKEIVSEYIEDKELLGGMKIVIGDEILDTTYRNKLNQLSAHLISK
ncbi:MAG: F0F1 ATP synthase subunit delta [Candidatus Nomurabacteria bacterium]|nr:F0F1 ATP synthase subunit delta [Candidatus Nomurabacteria bacterium]